MSEWTDERVAQLEKLLSDGLTGSEIANRLGGVTRNAVIGKAQRLGLKFKRRSDNPRCRGPRKPRLLGTPVKRARPKPPPAPRSVFHPLPPPHVDDIARVAFMDLEPHHCRFAVGHPGKPTFGFCGLHHVPGTSYCAGHLHRCTSSVTVTGQMAAHDKVTGDQTTAAAVEEILQPA